jgi:hypothetical protein
VKRGARERSDEWKKFVASVEGQQAVAKGLLGDEGIPGICIVSLAGMTDASRSKDEWRDTWRNLRLVYEGSTGEAISTGSSDDQKLGDVPVQQKVELRLIKNVNEASSSASSFPINTAAWGPVWLVHRYKGERDKADPKSWLVEFPVGAPDAKGSIRLKLKFERPLPELDKWPTR